MAKNVGWIKLFRKLIDNRMYFEEPFDKTHAWIDLLLNADKDGHLRVTIKELATRWKWSPNKVRRYIENLVSDDMVQIDGTVVGTKGGTILTLVKYKDFQLRQQNDGTKDGSNDGTTEWGKGDIYNNIYSRRKEEKNITPNNINVVTPKGGEKESKKRFVKPTVEEVDAYCRERGNNIDPQAFIDNYERVGWVVGKNKTPMKDWKATVRTWERNNFKTDKRKESPPVRDENFVDLSEYF